MAKSRKDRIAGIELEMEQLANKRKELLQQEKDAERKGRVSRFCKRMGLIESLMPDIVQLDDEHFKMFLVRHVTNNYGKRALASIISDMKNQSAATTAAPPETKPVAPAPVAPQQSSTSPAGASDNGANRNNAAAT